MKHVTNVSEGLSRKTVAKLEWVVEVREFAVFPLLYLRTFQINIDTVLHRVHEKTVPLYTLP